MGKLFGLLIGLLVIAGLAGAGLWIYGQHIYTKPGPATSDGAPRIVAVPRGANAQAIAAMLEEAGAIDDDFQFRMALRVLDWIPGANASALKAGEYAVPSAASINDILTQLSGGKSLQYTVVIPEGRTSAMIASLLAESDWKAEDNAGPPLRLAGEKPSAPAEGVMLPGGYVVHRGDTIESVVQRSIKAQQDLLGELWPNRQPGLPFKTREEAINLASIVENETGSPEERPLVASLFVNRLRKPMRLESDPTIVYGITRGAPLGHEIRASEKAQKTEWNTYLIDGLPKTPISNPGEAAIRAVLNPPTTGYYYFVADGAGNSLFAATYGEHLRNVAKYREFERQRNALRAAAKAGRR